jgi:hypothetical protein
MATLNGDHSILLANGDVIPMASDYEYLSLEGVEGFYEVMVRYPDDGELWVTAYVGMLVDGLAGGLKDGESFCTRDGSTYTRHGAEMVVLTPRREVPLLQAA